MSTENKALMLKILDNKGKIFGSVVVLILVLFGPKHCSSDQASGDVRAKSYQIVSWTTEEGLQSGVYPAQTLRDDSEKLVLKQDVYLDAMGPRGFFGGKDKISCIITLNKAAGTGEVQNSTGCTSPISFTYDGVCYKGYTYRARDRKVLEEFRIELVTNS